MLALKRSAFIVYHPGFLDYPPGCNLNHYSFFVAG
jgi:hypothetical protein